MRLIAVFLLLALTLSFAESFVAINSVDGRDVLSGIYYANVKGLPVKFIPMVGGDTDLFAIKVGPNHDILLIQGALPVTGFVENALREKNNTIELYASADGEATNMALARRSGATSFIIVDSAYSDGALSVLPYATLTNSYVLLSNKDNAAQIKDIVAGKKVTIFGYVDQEVKDQLESLNPEYIGKGEDKYEDNTILVKKTMHDFSLKRVIISDGSFIEDSMTGSIPLLLSGRIVPTMTFNLVKEGVREGWFTEVLLVGNDPSVSLVTPVYDMRGRINSQILSSEGLNKSFIITVKFAQVVPSLGSGALLLDTFPLPAYKPKLSISEVAYNTEGKKLMVRVDNLGEGAAFYDMETHVRVDGADYAVLTETTPKLIERAEEQGSEFALDLSTIPEGKVTANIVSKYGASKNSLDTFVIYDSELTTISFIDNSNVTVQNARYDPDKKALLVTMRNNGNQTVFVSSGISLLLGGLMTNITSPTVREIAPGSILVEEYPVEMTEADIKANKETLVSVDYGARRGFLGKHGQFAMPLEQAGFPVMIVGGLLLLIILAIVAYYVFGRKKKGKRS
jgi:hypothetical protein